MHFQLPVLQIPEFSSYVGWTNVIGYAMIDYIEFCVGDVTIINIFWSYIFNFNMLIIFKNVLYTINNLISLTVFLIILDSNHEILASLSVLEPLESVSSLEILDSLESLESISTVFLILE